MRSGSRKSRRYTDFIPVSVFVGREHGDDFLAGPFPGTIIDICLEGACLLMSGVKRNAFHVYHSTRKQRDAFLHIRIDSHPRFTGACFAARPVWFNTFQQGDFQERMMGVEFMAMVAPEK